MSAGLTSYGTLLMGTNPHMAFRAQRPFSRAWVSGSEGIGSKRLSHRDDNSSSCQVWRQERHILWYELSPTMAVQLIVPIVGLFFSGFAYTTVQVIATRADKYACGRHGI